MAKAAKALTRSRVMAILRDTPKDRRKSVACGLVGHSRMTTVCFGYHNCGRCEAQVGDALMGVAANAENEVVKGHNCPTCVKNAKTLTWRDRLLMPPATKWLAAK